MIIFLSIIVERKYIKIKMNPYYQTRRHNSVYNPTEKLNLLSPQKSGENSTNSSVNHNKLGLRSFLFLLFKKSINILLSLIALQALITSIYLLPKTLILLLMNTKTHFLFLVSQVISLRRIVVSQWKGFQMEMFIFNLQN